MIPSRRTCAVLLGACLFAPIGLAAADVHFVVESTRIYRDVEQKSTSDIWIAADRSRRQTDFSLWIKRHDLGLEWMVNRRAGHYLEEKLAAAGAAVPGEDIHTLGWDYGLGRVDWDIRRTGEIRTLLGLSCEHVVAFGHSDFAELTIHLWLAPAATPGSAEAARFLAEQARGDRRRSAVADLVALTGERLALETDETIDGPIAPVIRYRTKTIKLETADAPLGTYDLPSGLTRTEANGMTRPRRSTYELPAAIAIELRRLEETYRVLDAVADKVWPGWTGYKDVPVQLGFENGLKVLVGHPNPPAGFEPLRGTTVAGRRVSFDRRKLSGLELKQPLSCGGGIVPFGEAGGESVRIVDMRFTRVPDDPGAATALFRTEDSILILVHELFHCYQEENIPTSYGNLNYNADAHYAVYSTIEGQALARAYEEPAPEAVRAFVKDFLLARELKRKSMTSQQAKEESSDDVREGTAVYAEVRTLEVLRSGYSPRLSPADDLSYGGFKDIDALLAKYISRLKFHKDNIFEAKGKCYDYGCFQALLLHRLAPGWQAGFTGNPRFLDEELAKAVPLAKEDRDNADKHFRALYGLKAFKAKAEKAMADRDSAYRAAASTKGRTYTISLKEIGQFATLPAPGRRSFRLGLMSIFPDGVGKLVYDEVEIDLGRKPALADQIYHYKIVDPSPKKGVPPLTVAAEKTDKDESGRIYTNAVVTTPLFTLKAPKIRIQESENRIKIWVLARVK